MKLAHLGCLHFDDNRRPDDTHRVAQAFLDGAREAKVDLIVIGGDMTCDQTRPASETEREARGWFERECAEIAPTVEITGNHDAEVDYKVRICQRTKHPFHLYTRPNFPAESVGDLMVKTAGGLAGVLALPWIPRAGIASKLPASIPSSAITHAINELAGDLLRAAGMAAQEILAAGGVPILVHHGTVFEAESSSGWKPIGETVAFTVAQLREVGAAYVALNHFHNRQGWDGSRISYSGSIEPRGFGEPEPKGWNLVEIDGERFSNTFVELPARRIELIEADFTTEDIHRYTRLAHLADALRAEAHAEGALVRFRYRIRPEDMHLVDDDALRRVFLEAGAHEVTIEAVPEVTARVRCEEITTASTLYDEVLAWAGARGIEIDAAQRERLRLKLTEIEAPSAREVATA